MTVHDATSDSALGLRAGTAEVAITPPAGCEMIHRRADQGIHDHLWARTLAFSDGRVAAAVVGLDLISLSRVQVERIRARVRERLAAVAGLPPVVPAGLLLCCSHTHSGPVTNHFRGWGHADQAYVDALVEKVAAGVQTAFERLTPCRLSYGEASLQVGCNRRLDHADGTAHMAPHPDGPVDTVVRVLCVTAAETGARLGVLFVHGCHAVVLHRSTRMVSSDWPGRAAEYLKTKLGRHVCTVFAQGCGGDANSAVLNGTFADRDRLGVLAGRAALEAVERAEPVAAAGLAAALTVLPLPVRQPTPAEATAALAAEQARFDHQRQANAPAETLAEVREAGVGWARDLCRIASGESRERLDLDISALAFGNALGIVGLGAEAFHAYDGICRHLSPWSRTLVLAYVNGATCYLPNAAEFARRGYETAGADYTDTGNYAFKRYGTLALTPDCEEAVRHGVAAALAQLRPPPP